MLDNMGMKRLLETTQLYRSTAVTQLRNSKDVFPTCKLKGRVVALVTDF